MPRAISIVASLGVLVGGCHAPTFPKTVSGLRVTDGAYGRAHATRSTHIAVPIALDRRGTNGTAIVLEYLQTAERYGARYVSDLAIAIPFRHDGLLIECVSKIVVADGTAKPPPPAPPPPPAAEADAEADDDVPTYETAIEPWVPPQVSATVLDRDLICDRHGTPGTGWIPRYENRFDVEQKRHTGEQSRPAPMVFDDEIRWAEQCKLRPVRREVTRYAHFVAARFAPPDLVRIARDFSDWPLTEAPPACHPVHEQAGQPAPKPHIEAEVHFAGALAGPALPSRLTY